MTSVVELSLEVILPEGQSMSGLRAAFESAQAPDGVVVRFEDRSGLGAFGREAVLGLVLSIPIGISTSLIANWIDRATHAEAPTETFVVVGNEEVDVKASDGKMKLDLAIQRGLASGGQKGKPVANTATSERHVGKGKPHCHSPRQAGPPSRDKKKK